MLNRIILIGRLVAEPQLRYTQSGIAVANFRIAVDRPFSNQQGERETDFIDIVVWRRLAEICANNLDKGRLVAVEGRLQVRDYEYEGQRRRAAEVVADTVQFLDWPKGGSGTGQGPGGQAGPGAGQPGGGYGAGGYPTGGFTPGGYTPGGYGGAPTTGGGPDYGQGGSDDDFNPDDVPF